MKEFTIQLEEVEYREKTYEDLVELFSKEKNEIRELEGKTTDGKDVVFYLTNNGIMTTSPGIYSANVNSYIVFIGKKRKFNGIGIQARELDYFYDKKQAIKFSSSTEDDGVMSITTKPFQELQKRFDFQLNQKSYSASLNISRALSGESFHLNSELHVNKTDLGDMTSEIDLVSNTFLYLLKFVSNRLNIKLTNIKLKTRLKDGKYRKIGHYYIKQQIEHHEVSEKDLRKIIDYSLIGDYLPSLIKKISDGNLYLRHLPANTRERNIVTPARFIMSSAAFEWQYRNFETQQETYSTVKEEVINFLNESIKEKKGRDKKYLKGLLKLVKSKDNSLNQRMEKALNENESIMFPFIKHIYQIAGLNNYSNQEISMRLAQQRNDFAHGNLDKEFKDEAVFDLLVLEWLYYVIVLKELGLKDIEIQKAINQLFNRGLAI